MTILALEFSSDTRSVAIVRNTETLGSAQESVGRQTRAFAMITSALEQAGLQREAIEAVAVGLGPGSYTGIRAAVSIAQAWQLAHGLPILAIGTAELLAEQARRSGRRGRVHVAIDAQRGEFYHAACDLDDGGATLAIPLHLAGLPEMRAAIGTQPTIGWDDTVLQLLGADRFWPDAAVLAQRADERRDRVAEASSLQPIYLRPTSFVKAAPPRRPVGDEPSRIS